MSNKKIIYILVGINAVLISSIVVLRLRNTNSEPTVEEVIQSLPTGIVVPTENVATGELDIIAVSPNDGAEGVSTTPQIRITFSRSFTEKEIDFSIDPDAIYSQEIRENVLTISFWKPLAEGTLYTYSVNFPDDKQKVRLYRFVTEGELAEFLPDTRPDELIAEVEEYDRLNNTDIYITNRTPYENNIFAIRSEFDPVTPAHYYFIITSKVNDDTQVRQSVNAWLQLQGLTDDQIRELDIRYE